MFMIFEFNMNQRINSLTDNKLCTIDVPIGMIIKLFS